MTSGDLQSAGKFIPPIKRLAGLGILLGLLSYSALMLNLRTGGITVLWPSNGLLLSVLLLTRRKYWPAYVGVAYLVDLGTNLSLANPLGTSAYLAGCNMIEVLVAALLLYRVMAPAPDLTRRRQLTYFLLFGVLLAPAIAAFLSSLALQRFFGTAMAHI